MPTYEYECTVCQHRFEVSQGIKEEALSTCPVCGKPVKRVIGKSVNFILKGSGFYQNEYRSDAYKKQAKAESASRSAKPEAKATVETKATENKTPESNSESKPAAPAGETKSPVVKSEPKATPPTSVKGETKS